VLVAADTRFSTYRPENIPVPTDGPFAEIKEVINHLANAISTAPITRFNAIAGGTQKRHHLHGASPGTPPAGLLIRRSNTYDVRTRSR
jgi:hypothetical protein